MRVDLLVMGTSALTGDVHRHSTVAVPLLVRDDITAPTLPVSDAADAITTNGMRFHHCIHRLFGTH